MFSSRFQLSLLALTALLSPSLSQINLPRCIRDCIDKSPDTNCATSDIACLCRASSANFLPNLVTCIHNDCVNLEPAIFLGPLQFACRLAGAPIPDRIIQEAEDKASSLATAATTVTKDFTKISSVVVTTTEEGSTQTLIYPITVEKTKTVSGEPSTVTGGDSTSQTLLVPVVLTTTDSAGSTYTTTTSQAGSVKTYTTTNSEGSTVTQRTTLVSSPSSSLSLSLLTSATSSEGTTTGLTSATGASQASTSTASLSSTTMANAPAGETNSAPFTDTNLASGMKAGELGSWMGLGVAIVVGALWF